MEGHDKIQFDLVKLLSAERILRLTDPQSGLSLEKKLNPAMRLFDKRQRLLAMT